MKISQVKTAFKIADVVLNKKHPKNHIKFDYVKNLVDENESPRPKGRGIKIKTKC